MIDITRLYCGHASGSNQLRYGHGHRSSSSTVRPVVVWNATRRCNLRCGHCYAQATDAASEHELDTGEAEAFLDDLADFACPVVLFSGGEPLARPDLPRLVAHATARGLRAALSTNGILLDDELSSRLRDAGLIYAGISVDGNERSHNRLRRDPDAYRRTLAGLRAARRAGLRVGLRHTLTRDSLDHIANLFDLMEAEDVQRLCFYHLVPTGRAGETNRARPLTGEETRGAVDEIIDRTAGMIAKRGAGEVLTVDNHADGIHVYLRLSRENPDRAREALALLSANGGNRSGSAIACVGWDGAVHPDQFWRSQTLGNIHERRFSSIWSDPSSVLLSRLRDREGRIGGRCSCCRHFSLCRGNLRARAEALTGDPWASDPGCYLTDDEILAEETVERGGTDGRPRGSRPAGGRMGNHAALPDALPALPGFGAGREP